MARPSMTALLAVLAIAGYQNRDKIAEMLGGLGGRTQGPPGEAGQRGGQPMGGAAGPAGGIAASLGEGLRDLVDRFRQAGHGDTADSWVATGPNRELSPGQVEQAIDAETLDAIARQTGLSRQEILARLTRELPRAVDAYTPDGRLPTG